MSVAKLYFMTGSSGRQVLPDFPLQHDARVVEVRNRTREVCEDILRPNAPMIDRDSVFPDIGIRALVSAGLSGMIFPSEFGGTGDRVLAYVVVLEEIASACGSTSLVYMTQMHCGYPISRAGTLPQKKTYLSALNKGEIYGSLAVTEPNAGSDISGIATHAERRGRGFALNGTKTFITSGDRAGVIVVFARTSDGAPSSSLSAFLVDGGTKGLYVGKVLDKLGMKGSSTAELHFDDCILARESLLGEIGSGYALALQSVAISRVSAAAQGLGLAVGSYRLLVNFFNRKQMFDRARVDTRGMQFAIADMRSRITAARSLLYAVASSIDQDPEGDHLANVSMAKLVCTDLAVDIAGEAIDLVGIDGDLRTVGLERIFRDAKVTQIYDGTNQIQRMLIARDTRKVLESA